MIFAVRAERRPGRVSRSGAVSSGARVRGRTARLATAAVLILAACQAEEQPAPPPSLPPLDSPVAQQPSGTRDSLRLSMSFPASVRAGEPLRITFLVENVSDRPLDLHLTGGSLPSTFSSRVPRAYSWHKLESSGIPAVLMLKPLAPGESFTVSEQWDLRTNSGAPLGTGSFRTSGDPHSGLTPPSLSAGTARHHAVKAPPSPSC